MKVANRHLMAALVGLAVGVVVVVLIFAAITASTKSTQIRDTQNSNTIKADARDQALALVKDCVEPSGTCYKRGQAQTAKAVGDIARANAIAAAAATACAGERPHQTFAAIYACTTKRVMAAAGQP